MSSRRYKPIRDQRIANFVARGAGGSSWDDQNDAAPSGPLFDIILRVPQSAGLDVWQRAVGVWAGQHGERFCVKAALSGWGYHLNRPACLFGWLSIAFSVLAVYAGGILVAGPWPTLIDVQHLSSSIDALRYSKLLPARMELLRHAEEERQADAALVRYSSAFSVAIVVVAKSYAIE